MPTAEQQNLIDKIADFLREEPRIAAAWLAGSLGRGEGDAFSDVDMLALADDGTAAEVSTSLAQGLSAIAKPVLVDALFGGRVLNVVTQDWQRFDISIVQGDELNRYDAVSLTPLFNRSGRNPPTHPSRAYETEPERLSKLVNEFIRIVGLTPVAIGRAEFELALTGIDILRRLTFDLMLEENGIPPARRGGALHRNPLLTDAQRAALARLPPQAAERGSILAATRAYAAIFLPRARQLAAKIGMTWPAEFEAATRRHWQAKLGVDFAAPSGD